MKRSLLLCLALFSSCFADVTLDEITIEPPSPEKNFLIWQFLHQDINASQARDAFYQMDRVNTRFLLDYAKKTDEAEIIYTAQCLQKPSNELLTIEADDCLYLALTPAKAQTLQNSEREQLATKLGDKFGNVQWLRTMNQPNQLTPFRDIGASLRLFLITTPIYHQEHFNHTIDTDTLKTLTVLKGFGQFAYTVITDPKMTLAQRSLSEVSGGCYDFQTHFYLGMNALRYGRKDNALFHIKEAQKLANSKMDQDRTTFWLYQLTHEPSTLNTLSQSLDLNMYALWAKEKIGIEAENYFTTLPTSQKSSFKGDDPFAWNALNDEIMASTKENVVDLINRYDGEDSLAVQAYIIERAYTPFIHNFTMPYDAYMTTLTTDQKAFMYALMRQETRMIPGLISRSFALGLMQLMPFNVDTISKSLPLKVTSYNDMFNPAYNIPYAIEHMKHIDRTLFNPVLKAYAYNGGLGSTKRLILNTGQFLEGEHEPFMSMELVGNTENREYGKRVLANYVIYKKILGEEIAITSLLDNLVQPTQSDCFRGVELNSPLAQYRTE
ncbi:MAG: transglycosylase SLT domain-containing protein [Campylobacterales bacterium]|nr:transglycosylase SLT domain-containing protein [Campylobacterales bacterium]